MEFTLKNKSELKLIRHKHEEFSLFERESINPKISQSDFNSSHVPEWKNSNVKLGIFKDIEKVTPY